MFTRDTKLRGDYQAHGVSTRFNPTPLGAAYRVLASDGEAGARIRYLRPVAQENEQKYSFD